MAGTSKGKQGTSTGAMEYSPARAKRMAKKRRSEEASWRARNGPVIVRKVEDLEQGEATH